MLYRYKLSDDAEGLNNLAYSRLFNNELQQDAIAIFCYQRFQTTEVQITMNNKAVPYDALIIQNDNERTYLTIENFDNVPTEEILRNEFSQADLLLLEALGHQIPNRYREISTEIVATQRLVQTLLLPTLISAYMNDEEVLPIELRQSLMGSTNIETLSNFAQRFAQHHNIITADQYIERVRLHLTQPQSDQVLIFRLLKKWFIFYLMRAN